MSKLLLDALRKHDLQSYYPDLYQQKISLNDIMSQLSTGDYSKISFKAPNDKIKFMELYREQKELWARNDLENKIANNTNDNIIKNAMNIEIERNNETNKDNNENSDTRSIVVTKNERVYTATSSNTPEVLTTKDTLNEESFLSTTNETIIPVKMTDSKKRPYASTKQSPERNSRRMTTSNIIQHTPPTKQAARDRRLSNLPRQDSSLHRSPMRGSTTTTKITSPYKQQKPLSKPKVPEDFNIVEPPKETVNEQPSSRLLDAYGVPRSHAQQKKTADVPGSLEAFISRSKTSNISTTTIGTVSTTIQNDLQQRIRVCVRKRPLNRKEQDMHELDIVPVVRPRTIQLNVPKTKIDLSRYTETHAFTFDDVFDGTSSNEHIYARTAQPLVDYIFTGGKATCFAHGQTGSGKTYTMLDTHHGLYVLAAQDIFRMLSKPAYAHLSASVGFYEIYQGQLYDLLNEKQKLTARDDGNGNIVIANLREYSINDVNELMTAFEHGNKRRTTGKTGANNTSSRSHAVLQVFLKTDSDEKVYGKLSFIDLAGSERGADRGDANTKTRMEGAEINKSLLALKECIRALDQDKKHTPFRGSKLTQVLRDSFIGNSRTCMIATISPNNSNSEHTLNTLRYADRVKQLKGESDPRIQNNNTKVTIKTEGAEDVITEEVENVIGNDVDMTSIASWGEDENLLDVDFPTDMTANALSTPTNNRIWSAPEDRQEKYIRRLESPPAEMFISNHIMEDPFFSKPVRPLDLSDYSMDTNMSNMEISSSNNIIKKPDLNIRQIRSFLRIHRNQVQQFEECLAEEKKMADKISFTIAHLEQQNEEVSESTKQDYENYLNDLDELLDRKKGYIDLVRDKIKGELSDEV